MFYKASSIVVAVNEAIENGVRVRILLEASVGVGGAAKGSRVRTMQDAVPNASLYIWDDSAKYLPEDSLSAVVHAKCAVADRKLAFVTSANLTSAALERDMELGVLIRGASLQGRQAAEGSTTCGSSHHSTASGNLPLTILRRSRTAFRNIRPNLE